MMCAQCQGWTLGRASSGLFTRHVCMAMYPLRINCQPMKDPVQSSPRGGQDELPGVVKFFT